MSVMIIIHYYINLICGSITIYYNCYTDNLDLQHWPTIIYSGIINIITLSWQFFITYIHFKGAGDFHSLKELQIFDFVLVTTIHLTFFICILENWLKRQRLCKILQELKYLAKEYFSRENGIKENPQIKRKIYKRVIFKVIVFSMQLFFFNSEIIIRILIGQECGLNSCHIITQINLTFESYRNLFFNLIDMNMYMGLLFFYMCVQLTIKRLRNLENNLKLMQSYQKQTNISLNILRDCHQNSNRDLQIAIFIVRKLKNIAVLPISV